MGGAPQVLRNVGAQVGDDLLLTKPIGTGIITTALKRGLVDHKAPQPLTPLLAILCVAAHVTAIPRPWQVLTVESTCSGSLPLSLSLCVVCVCGVCVCVRACGAVRGRV